MKLESRKRKQRKKTKAIVNEIRTKNFLKMMKGIKTEFKKLWGKYRETIPRHFMVTAAGGKAKS